jgi:type II secretory ATPase GspE/PulE/Tfp pilus assembly ATPase PilB-like protein
MTDIVTYLVECGVITKAQGDAAGSRMIDAHMTLTKVLRAMPGVDERVLLKAIAACMKMPYADSVPVGGAALRERISLALARHHGMVPVSLEGNVLTVAVSDPMDRAALEDAQAASGCRMQALVAPASAVEAAVLCAYGLGADAIAAASGDDERVSSVRMEDVSAVSDAGVISLVNQIIHEAIAGKATDIHLEPYRSTVRVRMRADGELRDMRVADAVRGVYEEVVARVKVMAQMDTVERRRPQDGRAAVKSDGRTVDLRISVIPSAYGESVVIRILPGETAPAFEPLGFYPEHAVAFRTWSSYPHGIIFVSGPTGSGKTTTLYAFLRGLDREKSKIVTMEDPVEYELEGITQIAVNPQIGFTFASALRSVLRHDPDVIMVGEVRDSETAELAVRSALTGHLMFSTIHTNDAVSAPLRLIDLGVEPFLIASAVRAFVAQRLVRVLCPHCKRPHPASCALPPMFAGIPTFAAVGCELCEMSGYKGRTVIYEMLPMNDIAAAAIRPGMTYDSFRSAVASAEGTLFFETSARRKVAEGITSPEEVLRVLR